MYKASIDSLPRTRMKGNFFQKYLKNGEKMRIKKLYDDFKFRQFTFVTNSYQKLEQKQLRDF
jgi:hypothetical protein